jgi:hypothetical protein
MTGKVSILHGAGFIGVLAGVAGVDESGMVLAMREQQGQVPQRLEQQRQQG